MISVLISSESRYPVDRKRIRQKLAEFIKNIGLDDVEVSVLIVGSRKMRELSRQWREVEGQSDVLSFPTEEPRGPDGILRIGDVVVCYPEAREKAASEGKLVDEKIEELLEHGLRHLLGEHHD